MKTRSTYPEKLQQLADAYIAATGKVTATTKEMAVWAIDNDFWDPPRDLIIKQCQEDFSRALREQYITNDKGQSVRAKHVARVTRGNQQLYLWADIRNAPPEHMQAAFQQRRKQIVGDCVQLKRDVDYYNSQTSEPIQLVFDFTVRFGRGRVLGYIPYSPSW